MLTIKISDVGAHSECRLDGTSLTMAQTGGCTDVLAHTEVSESMTDEQIEGIIYAAWTEGYEGDPEASGLSVVVRRERLVDGLKK